MERKNFILLLTIGLSLCSCAGTSSSADSSSSDSSDEYAGGESTVTGITGSLSHYKNEEEKGASLSFKEIDNKYSYEVESNKSYILTIDPVWVGSQAVAFGGNDATFGDHSFCDISYFGGIAKDTSYLITLLEVGEFELTFSKNGHSSSIILNSSLGTGMLYAPSNIEKASSISESSKTIYNNFVDMVVPNFFKTFGKDDLSVCLSLPDLFLCYNMMAILSETSVQEAYAAELGTSSMEEVANVSKELIPVFCYVSNEKGDDSGAFNLNGLFFSPDLELKDNADSCFKVIAEAFNGYVFREKPSTGGVDAWIREADKEGYLADIKTPEISEQAIVTTVSSYALFDAFEQSRSKNLERVYQEGGNRTEYTLADGSKKDVDCLSFTSEHSRIERGENYVAATGHINTSSIIAYYPEEGITLSELSESIFSDAETTRESYDEVHLKLPMFDVDTSLTCAPNDLVPSFVDGVGTGFFEKEEDASYGATLGQNNKLTLDYNGFKGVSITQMSVDESAPENPTEFTLEVNRPFIFKITRAGLPLYYGQINDPGYSQYQ